MAWTAVAAGSSEVNTHIDEDKQKTLRTMLDTPDRCQDFRTLITMGPAQLSGLDGVAAKPNAMVDVMDNG